MLSSQLEEKGISYEERELIDPQVSEEAKATYGVRVAPISVVSEEFFYGTFAEQQPKLAEALNLV